MLTIAIQAVSAHPLLGRAIQEIFAHLQDFEVLPSWFRMKAEAVRQRKFSAAFSFWTVAR